MGYSWPLALGALVAAAQVANVVPFGPPGSPSDRRRALAALRRRPVTP